MTRPFVQLEANVLLQFIEKLGARDFRICAKATLTMPSEYVFNWHHEDVDYRKLDDVRKDEALDSRQLRREAVLIEDSSGADLVARVEVNPLPGDRPDLPQVAIRIEQVVSGAFRGRELPAGVLPL